MSHSSGKKIVPKKLVKVQLQFMSIYKIRLGEAVMPSSYVMDSIGLQVRAEDWSKFYLAAERF